jgi:hypothetical protein
MLKDHPSVQYSILTIKMDCNQPWLLATVLDRGQLGVGVNFALKIWYPLERGYRILGRVWSEPPWRGCLVNRPSQIHPSICSTEIRSWMQSAARVASPRPPPLKRRVPAFRNSERALQCTRLLATWLLEVLRIRCTTGSAAIRSLEHTHHVSAPKEDSLHSGRAHPSPHPKTSASGESANSTSRRF